MKGDGGQLGGGHGHASPLPLLLPSVDLPAGLGGPLRQGGGPVPPDGAGLPRDQGPAADRPPLRVTVLLAAVVLLPPLRRRPVPQLQVSDLLFHCFLLFVSAFFFLRRMDPKNRSPVQFMGREGTLEAFPREEKAGSSHSPEIGLSASQSLARNISTKMVLEAISGGIEKNGMRISSWTFIIIQTCLKATYLTTKS